MPKILKLRIQHILLRYRSQIQAIQYWLQNKSLISMLPFCVKIYSHLFWIHEFLKVEGRRLIIVKPMLDGYEMPAYLPVNQMRGFLAY